MSKMLTMNHAEWTSIRESVALGRRTEALARIERLLARPDVSRPVAANAHRLAGELLTDAERFAEARRHLRAAAVSEPNHSLTHYLWGLAQERDPQGCDRRAAKRFRKACRLEPKNALYRAAFGRAAVRCDAVKIGVRELLAAADVAPGDVAVLHVAIDGLLEAGRTGTARRILNRASFLCRDAAQDRELHRLLDRVRFATAQRGQRGERGTTRQRQDANLARDGGRVVLPFIRLAVTTASRGTRSVRGDVISFPRPHFPRLGSRRADG
jgi:tetratricopeptide (TPR) repeat protein